MRAYYLEFTGKTEEEAIEKALRELNLERDEITVEILERAKAGFLGIGRTDAKIRIGYGKEIPDNINNNKIADQDFNQERNQDKQDGNQDFNQERNQDINQDINQDTDQARNPEKRTRKSRNRKKKPENNNNNNQDSGEKADKNAGKNKNIKNNKKADSDSKPEPNQNNQDLKPDLDNLDNQENNNNNNNQDSGGNKKKKFDDAPPVFSDQESDDEKSQAIKKFLSGLLEHLNLNPVIRVYPGENARYKVILEGEDMGSLIGRRGETLDAVQQLTNYAVNRSGGRVRVQLDAEGYREKRERSLRNLARKEAAKVIKFRRSRTLEPMNAYERHVIHTALQDYRGVNTYSTGVDPNRRVIIAYNKDKL